MTTKITNDNITSVDAAKLTGSLPGGMAPETDMTPIENDLAVLALQNAVNSNITAHGLQNSWIEQFEDSSAIAGLTDCARSAAEYVSSISYGTPTYLTDSDIADTVTFSGTAPGGLSTGVAYNMSTSTASGLDHIMVVPPSLNNQSFYWPSPSTGGATNFYMDYLQSYRWTGFKISKNCSAADVLTCRLSYSDDASNWSTVNLTGGSASTFSEISSHGYDNIWSGSTFDANGVLTAPSTASGKMSGSIITLGTAINSRYLRVELLTWNATANSNVGWGQFIPAYQALNVSSTGSFTSTTITPQDSASKSSLGLVILYKNNAGTNTLNTDVICKVSADNGSNYSTCVLASKGTFSTGINIAIAPAIAVTAGTQLKYKVEFANQASGSKEAQIHGIALQY